MTPWPLSEYQKIYKKFPSASLSTFKNECTAAGCQDSDTNKEIAYRLLYTSSSGSKTSSGSKLGLGLGGLTGLSDVFSTTSRYGSVAESETFGSGKFIESLLSLKSSGGNFATAMMGLGKEAIFSSLETVLKNIGDQLSIEAQLRTDINEKIGLAGEYSRAYRESIIDTLPTLKRFGYGVTDITNLQESMMTKSGRFNFLSKETMGETAKTARAFVGDLSDMGELFSSFEAIGVGVNSSLSAINKAGKGSLEIGLNSRQTIKDIRENIGKLNEYGFSKGIQGLAEMSRKAKEFRMDMGEVFKIADKVMSPEGAIDLAANLQVLGGAIGDFGDPLKMLYDSTNNVEGLQDALIGAAGSLASYNSEQGRFEITGVNLRRAKEMAQQLGISYQELAKGAIASQERMAASSALMAKGLNMDDKTKEFLTNISRMEGGQMVISVPESLSDEFLGKTQLTLDELTKEQIQVLEKNRKAFEEMSPEDIARDQFESIKNIERDIDAYLTTQRTELTRFAKSEKGLNLTQTNAEIEKAIRQEVDRTLKTKEGTVLKSISQVDMKDLLNNVLGSLKKVPGIDANLTSIEGLKDLQSKLVKEVQTKLEYNDKNKTQTSNTTNLNITSDVTTDIITRNLLRSDQVWQEVFSKNPREFTTLGQ